MEPSERLEEEHNVNPPSWRANYQCFYTGKNRVVKITRSSSKMVL
jgi:hypothetical protein